MDIIDLDGVCRQQFQADSPHVAAIVGTVTDLMELALLAVDLPETFTRWGIDSPRLLLGFREAVRDRYQELVEAQSRQSPLTR